MLLKKSISSLALLAIFTAPGSAWAADLRGSTKDTPVAASEPAAHGVNWSGVYLGVQGGWMNANHEISADESCSTCGKDDAAESFNLINLDGLNSSGFIGGGTAGFDRQLGNWVLGVQAYYHFTNADTTLSAADGLLKGSLEKENEYGAVIRAGRLLSPNVLAYGLGGYNWAKYSLHASIDGDAVDFKDSGVKTSNTFGGVILGGGVEYALTSNIFVGAEYTHFFGGKENWFSESGTCGEGCTARATVSDDLSEDRIMATLKVKLNGGLFGN